MSTVGPGGLDIYICIYIYKFTYIYIQEVLEILSPPLGAIGTSIVRRLEVEKKFKVRGL